MKYSLVLIALMVSSFANAEYSEAAFSSHKKVKPSSLIAAAAMENVLNRIDDEVLSIASDSVYNNFTTLVVRTRDGRLCQAATGLSGGRVICLINAKVHVRFAVDSSGNIID